MDYFCSLFRLKLTLYYYLCIYCKIFIDKSMIVKRGRIIGMLCFFLITTSLCGQSKDYILILNSIGAEGVWSEYFNLELKKDFNQRGDLKLETYALSVPFMKDESEVSGLQKKILERYTTPPLAVVIVGDPCWMVCAPLFDKEWKDIPIVLCYSRPRIPSSLRTLLDKVPLTEENSIPLEEFNKHYNITVLENPVFLEKNIDLIRRMQPQMKKLAFISDNRYISVCTRAELADLVRKRYSDLELDFLTENELSTEQLMDTLSSYGPTVGILYYSWIKSEAEKHRSYIDRYFNRTLFVSAHSPIYTVNDVDPALSGFAGGYYISVEDFTESCMTVLDKILAGASASSIPNSWGGVPHTYLNYATLQWYDVDSDLYPSDAVYYNQPLGFFERNRLLVCVSLVFLCLLFIVKYSSEQRNKKRNLLNRHLLKMLDSPVYMMDKKGTILSELNSRLHRSFDVLKQNSNGNISFEKQFVDEKEFVRYVRLINFVIWTGKVREKKIRLKDGSGGIRYLFTRIVPCEEERVLVLISDISEKEKARRQSEEYHFFLKTVLENLPIPVFVRDMKNSGRFTIWNKRLSEELGIPSSSVKGETSENLPEHIRRITDLEDSVSIPSDSSPVSLLQKLDCEDGSKKVLSVHYSLISYREEKSWLVGSAIDITELEKRKAELERLNQQYDLVLRAMGVVPWTWDLQAKSLKCNRTYISKKYRVINGFVQKTEEDHYHQIVPQFRNHFATVLQRLYSGEIKLVNEEYQIYYPGHEKPLWVESFVVVGERNAAGEPIELVGATTVIDERKNMEEELLHSKEQAEEANKMKSAFLANMTHEIRTPLSAITGFSALLAASNNTPENEEYIHIIENNSRILLQLVNDVLDMSKIESGALEFTYNDVNINASLTDLVSSWKMRIPPEVTILFSPVWDSCILCTDEIRLLQVMGNYISNAVKYTEKGTITVGYYPPSGGYIRFYVRDTGEGIPADKLSSVFDRFVKLDRFKQGTGLGLAICKMIAECVNGRVGVSSVEGQGSEFWFEHPYSEPV